MRVLIMEMILCIFLLVGINSIHAATSHTRHAHHVRTPHLSQKKHHVKRKMTHKRTSIAHANTHPVPPTELPAALASSGFVASIEKRLIDFVHNTVTTLRYSSYKLGGSQFDPNRGVYVVDCSNYVDRILEVVYPHAFYSLANWSGTDNPTTNDYYQFFADLTHRSKYPWNRIDDIGALRPGDVLVFRYKNTAGNETGGHVMIVMDKPVSTGDAFLVRVADSASGGHSQDTRQRHVSGIGIGTLLLKKDPKTFKPTAFAWKVGAPWKRNVNFAMARPREV